MEKILNFLEKYGTLVIVLLLMAVFINQCSVKNAQKKIVKAQKEMVVSGERNDSVLNAKFDAVSHTLDSTLISNGAVISANKQTSEAINNKKQNIVIKVDK